LLHGEYRLLGLATMFATEMIRRYGLLEYRKDVYMFDSKPRTQILSLPAVSLNIDVMENSRRLSEMGYLLEITRNIQSRITRKFKKLGKVVYYINTNVSFIFFLFLP
jgi:spatacsin